jgi:serine/threonine protein kinase
VPDARSIKQAILRDIGSDYSFGKVLGQGHFGTVRLARYKHNPDDIQQYAVKTLKKSKIKQDEDSLRSEVNLMCTLDHPNIVNLYSVYEDVKYFHLVMEH